jgi:hypothetical protein
MEEAIVGKVKIGVAFSPVNFSVPCQFLPTIDLEKSCTYPGRALDPSFI